MFTRNFFLKVVSSVWIKIKLIHAEDRFIGPQYDRHTRLPKSWYLEDEYKSVTKKYIIFKFDIGKYYILTYIGLDMHVRSNRNSIKVQGVCIECLRDKLSTMK